MKRKLPIILFFLIVICIIIGCASGGSGTSSQNNRSSESSSNKEVSSIVTEEELSEELSDINLTESEEYSETESSIYTFLDISKTMYVKQNANVRNLPDKSGEKVGSLSSGQEIDVTGQCNETGWYRIVLNGTEAYVSNSLLTDEKQVAEEPKQQETINNENVENAASEIGNTDVDTAGDSGREVTDGTAGGDPNGGTTDGGNAGTGGGTGGASGPTVTVPTTEDTVGILVWVPTNGGKKYHRKPDCSKMKDPMQVTVEHAEANGYTPCGRCYK